MRIRLPRIGAPALPARRRRTPRPDGPRTILPVADAPPTDPQDPFARLDAARERLRAQIPPRTDEE